MKQYWDYTKVKSNKGLTRKPPRFKDLGAHNIKSFVRELIQNCLDARFDESLPVEIRIVTSNGTLRIVPDLHFLQHALPQCFFSIVIVFKIYGWKLLNL